MNRELLKGKYLIPVESFERLDSLCNKYDYYIEPNDMPVHRIFDKIGTLRTSAIVLELQDDTHYLLTVLHTRHSVDGFAEQLYSDCKSNYIGPL